MILREIKDIITSRYPTVETVLSKSGELTVKVSKEDLISICNFLKCDNRLKFEQLVDLCGVDYLTYSKTNWETVNSNINGYSRAKQNSSTCQLDGQDRFFVVYHLLSYIYNCRIRVCLSVGLNNMMVPSVVDIWSTANWHECEAYDFFGVVFIGHPNLIKILTDYGFEGCPMRKDFPLSGEYEIRYDEARGKIIREPSFITRKMNTPGVVREDFRYK